MSLDFREFGRNYRRFLRLTSVLSHLPSPISHKLACVAGERLSPLRRFKSLYLEGVEAGGIPEAFRSELWQRRLRDHGVFCVDVFRYRQLNQAWFQRHVTMDVTGFQRIVSEGKGCLFLTYHHVFQHALFCVLGLAGHPVNVLAAPEESSPIHPEIGPLLSILHQGCASQFNGGNYLFFDSPRRALRMTRDALTSGSVLFALNDVPVAPLTLEKNNYHLYGRVMPVASGSVRLAQQLGVPIVTGALLRDGSSYRVVFRQLESNQSFSQVLQSYFDFLAELLIDRPEFWDGWEWFARQQIASKSEG